MPLPWKYFSRPRSVAVRQRISLIRCGAAEQLAMPRDEQRGGTTHVWRGHAGAVHALEPLTGTADSIFSPGATKSGFDRPSPVGPRLEK